MNDIPFVTTDWSAVPRTEKRGTSGTAYWRTREFGGIRVRMVEYTPGYLADHVQTEIANDAFENLTQPIEICKGRRVAAACVDEPFGS